MTLNAPRSGNGDAALAVHEVVHAFGGLTVLDNVSFDLDQGERVTLIGPNGAGKTTLFNVICGQLRPQQGQVVLNGIDVSHLPVHRRARLGIGRGFQITNLFPDLTVWETAMVAMIRRFHHDYTVYRSAAFDSAASDEVAATLRNWGFGKSHKALVREFSYGEQRRLDICLALMMKPNVLLLDEPTAGLSPHEGEGIIDAIKSLPRELACLIVTHDLQFGFGIADRVVAMYQGRVVIQGSPTDVQSDDLLRRMYF